MEWIDSRNFFPDYDVINSNTLLKGTPITEIYNGNILFFLYKSPIKARKAKIIYVSGKSNSLFKHSLLLKIYNVKSLHVY